MTFAPDWAVTPGEHLQEILERAHSDVDDLAAAAEIPRETMCAILAVRRTIDKDAAVAIARAAGTSATLWLRLQRHYSAHPSTWPTAECDDVQLRPATI
jgi:addiction module HigA family antidote